MSSSSEAFPPNSNTIVYSPGSSSISARIQTSKGIKKSKFKPSIPPLGKQEPVAARRPALTAFSTPGFQNSKIQHDPPPLLRKAVVYVSSDSSPPTPGRVKRDSSGLSILDEPPSHPSKRQKVVPLEEKENVLGVSSKVNQAVTQTVPSGSEKKNSDLASKSLDTLRQYQIYGLGLRNYFADECLAYHNGFDMEKDLVVIEEIREVIRTRLQAIEAAKKSLECRRAHDSLPKTNNLPAPFQTFSAKLSTNELSVESTHIYRDGVVPVPVPQREIPTPAIVDDDQGSDDGYWDGMEDISMHDPTVATTCDISSSASIATTSLHTSMHESLSASPFYIEILQTLQKVFKLTEFRTNQLEAITAALDGRDVFVLMPTGGGKSLCFQLPAICTSGKTKGVTVVVSPLLALMKDQVDSLTNKQVDALLSSAETAGEDWQQLVKSERKPKLWYVTPEKLRDSPKVNEILSILYRDGKLARFVIDEAHCISTWGQDFRDAYTALGTLRDKFPSVPIMALTATANKRTVADIITQLKLDNHAFYTQSFNRTNLKYLVRQKKSDSPIINEIVEFIQSNHRGEGGIIYCNARSKCESVAQGLQERGLSAAHFHAGMPTQEKDQTVRDWQIGSTLIIVATIAFGMGIDKANVRFVLHHDMPKSMSGYYQETGRAGRDGKLSDCLMYFSFPDLNKLIHQIRKSEDATPESIQRQENAAREVYRFAENTSECRRVQILQHFDEKFAKAQCARGCDVCEAGLKTVPEDVTTHAQAALKLVRLVNERGDKITLSQLRLVLRGANTSELRGKQFDKVPQHGQCGKLPKELLELMLNRLMLLEMLANVSVVNRRGFHNDYLEVGPSAQSLLENRQNLILDWNRKPERQTKQRKETAVGDSISAPPRSRKGKQKAVVEDDPIEVSDEMYEWDDEGLSLNGISQPSVGAGPLCDAISTRSVKSKNMSIDDPVSMASSPTGLDEEVLYRKMLSLRNEIALKEKAEDGEVFDDTVLQYLSLVCPSDYHSFKRELANGIDLDGPEGVEYVNERWNKWGQQFLEMCIHHKTLTGSASKTKPAAQAVTPAVLHSKYDYRPPVGASSKVSTLSVGQKPKPKFKPALPS